MVQYITLIRFKLHISRKCKRHQTVDAEMRRLCIPIVFPKRFTRTFQSDPQDTLALSAGPLDASSLPAIWVQDYNHSLQLGSH